MGLLVIFEHVEGDAGCFWVFHLFPWREFNLNRFYNVFEDLILLQRFGKWAFRSGTALFGFLINLGSLLWWVLRTLAIATLEWSKSWLRRSKARVGLFEPLLQIFVFDCEVLLIICEMHQIVIAFVVEKLDSRCARTSSAFNQVFLTEALMTLCLILHPISLSSDVALLLTVYDCWIFNNRTSLQYDSF